MATSNNSRLSPASVATIIVISVIVPLCASVSMAARFLSSLGQGADAWVLFLVSGAIIFSSVALGHLIGLCLARSAPSWVAIACAGVWLLVVTFSTSTSALSLLNSSGSTISRQILDSPQNRNLQASIDANLGTIKQLQQNINNSPTNWLTKRGQWAEQIADLNYQNKSLLNMQGRLTRNAEGSSVAQSFAALSRYGITRDRLAMLCAMLLDLIPFVCSIALSYVLGMRGKKSVGTVRHLNAVA